MNVELTLPLVGVRDRPLRPLLSSLLAPTPPVQLATGRTGQLQWQFWAKASPLGQTPTFVGRMMFQPGISTNFLVVNQHNGAAGGSGPGGNPFELPRFDIGEIGPTGIPGRMLLGITSVPAYEIRVSFVGSTRPMLLRTLTSTDFPGLWFFVADVPPSSLQSAEVLASDGRVLDVVSKPLS